jgi:sorbitol-specific phosphotransferase system component IIC
MNKILAFIKTLWTELDSVIELFVYLGIAYGIMKLFNLTYLQSISIVFIYFVLNLLRLLVETFRNR